MFKDKGKKNLMVAVGRERIRFTRSNYGNKDGGIESLKLLTAEQKILEVEESMVNIVA